MRRAGRIFGLTVGILLAVLAVGIAALYGLANTGWGMRFLAGEVPTLTAGQLAVSGLSGRFPDRLHVVRGELRDKNGAWARLRNVTLVWDPLALIHSDARIDRLTAGEVTVLRLPQLSSSKGGSWPARIDIGQWRIGKLALAASLVKMPAALTVMGSAHLSAEGVLRGSATAHRLDGAGDYRVAIDDGSAGVTAHFVMTEPAHGLVSELAGMPEFGAIDVAASVTGPRGAERLEVTARAGELRATAHGTIDLLADTADLVASATAPAMSPRADLGWQGIAATVTFKGEFAKPEIAGQVRIKGPRANGAAAQEIALDAKGSEGAVHVTGSVTGLVLPGAPDLFAQAPVAFVADARLDTAPRTVEITLNHPMLRVSANAAFASLGNITGNVKASLPTLAPLAKLAGMTLDGSGTVSAAFARGAAGDKVTATGTVGVTGGQKTFVNLIGAEGRFDFAATLAGGTITIARAHLTGAGLRASLSGSDRGGTLDLAWEAMLPDLGRLTPRVRGAVTVKGRLSGLMNNLAVTASLDGDVGGAHIATGPVTASLEAHGLPAAPQGRLTADGRLAGAPLKLDITARRGDDGTVHFAIAHAAWKGTTATGALQLPAGARWPGGRLDLRLRLADFAAFIAGKPAGDVAARLDFTKTSGGPQLGIAAEGHGIALAGARIGTARLDGRVADVLASAPRASLHLKLAGIDVGKVGGAADVTADGSINALALRWSSRWQSGDLTAASGGSATLDAKAKSLRLTALGLTARGETARLLVPARIDFANGIAVDRLRIGTGRAVLEVRGRLTPRLDATIALRNVTPALAHAFVPGLKGGGSLRLDATLKGSLATPLGTVHLVGQGLTVHSGDAAALPPARIEATAHLDGTAARLEARLSGGRSARLVVAGSIPLKPAGSLALTAKGTIDLALLDPIIAAEGRSVRGTLTLDGRIEGTLEAPRVAGSATLAKGNFQDYVQGIHLTNIAARFDATNGVLHIAKLTGHAGQGTLAVSGTVDLTRPTIPIALKITAKHARPIESDILSANLNASLTLKGNALGSSALAGTIFINRANITVPDKFPTEVAVLKVRRPGEAPPPKRAVPPFNPRLAITLDAPQQVFVRGHGVDAELGGKIEIAGTARNPKITGALSLRRGTFDLVGQTLNFTSGSVTFDQASLKRKIDPAIHFVAQSSANNVTATLTVAGYANAPEVTLTSSPQLPADQIMAQLLFGQNVTRLSPLQLASVAQGVASLGGIGGSGGTLSKIRKTLGLDRLSVGSDTKGTGAAIEAGRYVTRGVYVGAKQGISGGTQAQVQIDITKHLKAQTTLGYGNGAPVTGITPQNDPGSSVGLTYQFEY
ncbi:MAG: translocation/assembly module TamB domain-containing protein [Stellaceae bacterium]